MSLFHAIYGEGGVGPTPGPTPTPTDLEPVLLWENPSTTMVAETVTLDLTEYAGVLIESQSYMGSGGSGSRLYVKKGERLSAGRNNANDSSGGGSRAVTVTDSGVTFEECYFTADKNNAGIVPTKIFGVKEYVVEPVCDLVYKGETVRTIKGTKNIDTGLSEIISLMVKHGDDTGSYSQNVVCFYADGEMRYTYSSPFGNVSNISGGSFDFVSTKDPIDLIYYVVGRE